MTIQIANIILLALLAILAIVMIIHITAKEKERQEKDREHDRELTEIRRRLQSEYDDRLKESSIKLEAEMFREVNQKKEELMVEVMNQRTVMHNELREEREAFSNKNQKEMQENLKQYEKNMQMSKERLEKEFNQEKSRIDQANHELQSAAKMLEDKLMNEQNSINKLIADMLKMRGHENLGRIIIGEIDLKEISEINSVIKYFRNPTVIKKAIFEAYYRNPVREMINLITGGERISGIYKITNVLTDQCYIGQSVNIGDRWLNHIKRGIGAEAPTNSLLYPEMLEHGIENFRFEILEITDDLSAREKFYGEVYAAKTIGYNIRIG